MRTAIALLFCAALAAPMAPAQQRRLCALEGRVVNDANGEPLRDAKLKLQPAKATGSLGRVVFVTMTDETGRFAFAGLEPDAYNFSAERAGFVTANYGAKASNAGSPLTMEAGEKKTGVEFRLKPQGVITGRLYDSDGETGSDVIISVSRIRYVKGKRELARVAGNATANDLGVYRISGLEPGRYYVVATPFPTGAAGGPKDLSGAPQGTNQITYYPSTADMAEARPIDVTAGATVSGADIQMVRGALLSIRGRIVNQTGAELTEFSVTYQPPGGVLTTRLLQTKQQFEIGGMPRGRHLITVNAQSPHGHTLYARRAVDLNDTTGDVEIPIQPPFQFSGRLAVEGAAVPRGLRVSLIPQENSPNINMQRHGDVGEGGAFAFPDVTPDMYYVSVSGIPDGFYVRSVRMGEADALENGVDLTKKLDELLQVTLSPKAGSIRGAVSGADGAPAPGAVVALVPQGAKWRARAEWYRNVSADQSGRFTLANLPPGEYKLFAWEDVEDTAWLDADFLKPFEDRGKLITVRQSGAETVELTAIR
jgi:protocatechuate 3,4-dioxygenase beta subunit